MSKSKNNIIVQKVDLNLEEIEKYKLIAEAKEESIKYLTNELLKLRRKLLYPELNTLNILSYTYNEILKQCKAKCHNSLIDYVLSYIDYDCINNEILVGEDGIDLKQGDILLINSISHYFIVSNESNLKRDVYKLSDIKDE